MSLDPAWLKVRLTCPRVEAFSGAEQHDRTLWLRKNGYEELVNVGFSSVAAPWFVTGCNERPQFVLGCQLPC